jgi:endonuclease/exonuclease/phosphatase family metal-dependent hydrolase
MTLRVLTWNLYHGRAVPPAGRALFDEFAAALAGWRWDVALLQEVPPWWPAPLARATDSQARRVLTSRNFLLPVRRFVAERWPDLIRSNGGGANAILVRGAAIESHATVQLCRRPERRWAHAVWLDSGICVVNLHATVPKDDPEQKDLALALRTALRWAGDRPLVFGGDVNQRKPRVPGLEHVAGHHVDHLFARGFEAAGPAERLEHGALSDHDPLAVDLRASAGSTRT